MIRHPKAITQYRPGPPARLSAIDAEIAGRPGLFLTGSSHCGAATHPCACEAEAAPAGPSSQWLCP